jgi:hypothetical protein
MYRTAPYSDIAYIFTAASEPRRSRGRARADAKYVIQLTDKIRLLRPVKLDRIKSTAALSQWSFARNVQGIMRRRRDVIEEGAWPALRRLIIGRNPYVASALRAVPPTKSQSLRPRARLPRVRAPRQRTLQVFLSYGSQDLDQVQRLYRRLCKLGWVKPWFNKDGKSIKSGEDWEVAVGKAIEASDAVVICLSSSSVKKIGFFQTEIGRALLIQEQQPEGTSFISPIRLNECEVPNRLAKWHCSELFERGGFQDLVASLERRAAFLAVSAS